MDNWRPPHLRYEMSHDRGCYCGREKWEYEDCSKNDCIKRWYQYMAKTQRMMRKPLNTPEPPPVPNNKVGVWTLVMADMAQRDIEGMKKYGTRLQPNNGRDALTDAYQEALDLAVYLRQAIYERDGK